MNEPGYSDLMRHARDPADLATLAFAGVISQSLENGRRPLIRGLSEAQFAQLLDTHFPGLSFTNGEGDPGDGRIDEFDDLVILLNEYRALPSDTLSWLACAIATASLADNHLWQDMGLPHRAALSALMQENYPGLKAKNVGDMKWKKFFYRQLCERADVLICKSPSCAICTDYSICFGREEGEAKVPVIADLPIRSAP